MTQVNISDAKEHFSDWLELLLSGNPEEFLVIKDGEPVAKISPIKRAANRQPGLGKGKFDFDYDAFMAMDAEILDMFDDDWGFKEGN